MTGNRPLHGKAALVTGASRGVGGAIAIKADLLVPAELDRLVEQAIAAVGHIDVLVNNAPYIGDGC